MTTVEATVHGAISLVNAIATGRGATIGIDTFVTTKLQTLDGTGIHISADNKTISSRLINRVIEKIVPKTELKKTKLKVCKDIEEFYSSIDILILAVSDTPDVKKILIGKKKL